MNALRLTFLVGGFASISPHVVHAADAFDFDATSTVRIEHYGTDDDTALPLYPEDGWQSFGELSFDANRRISAYETLRLRGSGLANDSTYRSDFTTYSSENLAATWEKGDVALPFRLDGGDYFGFYSYRTLQRPLKGVQAELQPGGGGRQSILVTAGSVQPTYRDFDASEDAYIGLSWRFEPAHGTGVSANVVSNQRDETDLFDARDQTVGSIAAEHQFRLFNQDLSLAMEAAYLSGEVDLVTDAGDSVDSRGLFAELAGHSASRIDYRLRYEDYGDAFLPNGGAVSADRKSGEAHLGWRSTRGMQMSSRLQRYREGEGAGNAVDTDVAGFRVGAPIAGGRASSALDVFFSRRDDDLGLVDTRTASVRIDLMGSLTAGLSGRVGAQYQRTDDDVFQFDQKTSQLDVGLDRRGAAAGWTWQVAPRLVLRSRHTSTSDGTDLGPGIAFGFQRGIHSIRGSYSYLGQQLDSSTPDTVTQSGALAYSATKGAHRLTFELELRARDTDDNPLNRGDRAALVYTYTMSSHAAGGVIGGSPGTTSLGASAGGFDALTFARGLPLVEAQQRLAAEGFGDGVAVADLVLYEAQVLDDVPLRQRLVLEVAGDVVVATTLVLDFDVTFEANRLMQDYETTRAALLDRYGAPVRSMDQGTVAQNVAAAIASGTVVRLSEWDTQSGVLRLGVPVRLDGSIRIELRHGDPLPMGQTRWGLELLY